MQQRRDLVVCVDVGSTWTKAALVDPGSGTLLGRASHPTTLPGTSSSAGTHTDVLEGLDACVDRLALAHPGARDAEVLACSSAGGGLRIGVVGNEELVSAEAGRRVALTSGGRVVAVVAGAATPGVPDLAPLEEGEPDVVLLVGGTDGGDREVLLRCAQALAGQPWPVVVAGNADAAPDVVGVLDAAGTRHTVTGNVLPRIGVLEPGPARGAIREAFLAHVIGGRDLSPGPRFPALVRGATPDLVLTAVELLADHPARVGGSDAEDRPGVVVVDVGGATSDVYSVVPLPEEPDGPGPAEGLGRDVVAATPANRTVEGDLGLRWSAAGTVAAATAAGDLPAPDAEEVDARVRRLRDDPGVVPSTVEERALDARLTGWAATEALRRHSRSGVDLRTVGLVVGSGGALRHAADPAALLATAMREDRTFVLPQQPRVAVDTDYVLAAAGLLAEQHPQAAYALLERFCGERGPAA